VQQGVTETTLAKIRARAHVSTGSLYHHFPSKAHLAAALYIEGLRQAQHSILTRVMRQRQAAGGIRAMVQAYLDWVQTHPEYALFLLTHRQAEFMQQVEAEVATLNADFQTQLAAWVAPHVQAGVLPPFSSELYGALVMGPCEYCARRWLMGDRQPRTLVQFKRQLAKAVFPALQALC
jgi:AcrR family transcriptional regulator